MTAIATVTGVTCGNCTKQNGRTVKHNTASDVRACYAGKYNTDLPDHNDDAAIQRREAEEDERAAFRKISAQKQASAERAAASLPSSRRFGFSQNMSSADEARAARASENPWAKVRELQDLLPVSEHMRYAIEVLDFEKSPEPVWKFYQIDKPVKGKWAGRTFVNVLASDTAYPVRNPESIKAILEAILHDPEKAASNYGKQIGKCGVCNRTLTHPESIAAGIGPVCENKVLW